MTWLSSTSYLDSERLVSYDLEKFLSGVRALCGALGFRNYAEASFSRVPQTYATQKESLAPPDPQDRFGHEISKPKLRPGGADTTPDCQKVPLSLSVLSVRRAPKECSSVA